MTNKLSNDSWGDEYGRWLADVKQTVERARLRAVASVNRELVTLYWQNRPGDPGSAAAPRVGHRRG
ncbi:hypothetical protein BURKHO8Y_580085 [Burkholderia sp. 8Y]|nr:hypothetical protein BURKHO8Y_580085 [Burkholderia sp. 8Y]